MGDTKAGSRWGRPENERSTIATRTELALAGRYRLGYLWRVGPENERIGPSFSRLAGEGGLRVSEDRIKEGVIFSIKELGRR